VKATGQIICVRQWGGEEDYQEHMVWAHGGFKYECDCEQTVRCQWVGGLVAEMSSQIRNMARRGENSMRMTGRHTIMIADQVHVRLICMKVVGGWYHDLWYVMREGWYARLVHLDYGITFALLQVFVLAECGIRRLFGQHTEGQRMKAAGFLAERLL
jgi:hypothetical protein